MQHRLLILTIFLFSVLSSNAQNPKGVLKEERSILYRHESSGSISIHSGGWAASYRRGKHITGDLKAMWEVELATMSHPKEFSPDRGDYSSSFAYGKTHGLLITRTGYGRQ